MLDKTLLLRQLVPKTIHFNPDTELNCEVVRDKPFFSRNTLIFRGYCIETYVDTIDKIRMTFNYSCSIAKISFKVKDIRLKEFVDKLQKPIQKNSEITTIEIEFITDSSCCKYCHGKKENCFIVPEGDSFKKKITVSFYTEDVKMALDMYFGTNSKQNNKQDSKGEKKMGKNSFLGANFELGMSKDPNISATLMGVAVKNPTTGNWYTFDAAKNSLKNIANLKMGDFPIFLLPTKQLQVGDLIKKDGKYYYVKAVEGENIAIIGACDGIIQQMMPEESIILGMAIYTKVVAFDTQSLMEKGSNKSMGGNVLAAMCMMNWAKGDSSEEFSLDNISDDSFNGLGTFLPMLVAMKGGDIGGIFENTEGEINLPMLLMCGAGNGGQNEMMQMLIISQLLGGKSKIGDIGKNILANSVNYNDEQVICEQCNVFYDNEVEFCPKCGAKTKSLVPTCRKCGVKLYPEALFCHKCGESTSIRCPKCGIEVDKDANFCPNCGNSFKEVTDDVSNVDSKESIDET